MPRRTDLETILVIGSGPIVIGQACEFDYSGTQGIRALREEGYRVVLVNSNPATIMTDPELADRTYIEPLTPETVADVIRREKPQALLPTLGGQTALNLALELHRRGVLAEHGVELIGAQVEAIEKAEDREQFKAAMARIGLSCPTSGYVRTVAEAEALLPQIGFPAIIRPSFTLGGSGASIAEGPHDYAEKIAWALQMSPRGEVLVERSALGWKEFELEVMRDANDNVVIICSIENFDPMGVHTGDSITVAPAMTLTDREYQGMRDAALAVIREIGVATGGSNIQFAVNPDTGEMLVIEMNPRVSRSSALASKATGFPIAKIAAKLAVGYTLDEIPNDITSRGLPAGTPFLPASFEPTIDYVIVKIPRFSFEKFPGAEDVLTTQMKSVGEVMAIGRTFKQALNKAVRSLEIGAFGFDRPRGLAVAEKLKEVSVPRAERLFLCAEALRAGISIEDLYKACAIDRWFLQQLAEVVAEEERVKALGGAALAPAELGPAKELGLSDRRIAQLAGTTEERVAEAREAAGILPIYRRVDTCAAEFAAQTPYLYSSYEPTHVLRGAAVREDEAPPTGRPKVVILGGGPNRIGQGIEFDYCCVHASFALREAGFETVMVNCNPETVSTDYDVSDRLYFEPLTREDVLAICAREQPVGVIVQFGGQTPLKLAVPLEKAGVRLLGTPADAIDRAEDRQRFGEVLAKLGLRAPRWGTARGLDEARQVAHRIGYPVVVRPSYVLGGRAMQVVYDDASLAEFAQRAVEASPEHPILVDEFLSSAIEVDVDALCDRTGAVFVAGVMEHIEEAGIHSGDSACALPPYSLPASIVEEIERQVTAIARELGVVGLMNTQFAVKDGQVWILEVNPRASRTVPFVSKATGLPVAKLASLVMAGKTLAELAVPKPRPSHVSVKEAVFPFAKFPGVDTILGPEMRSTGEVMGIDATFPRAFAKAQLAAGTVLPTRGTVFLSVRNEDKAELLGVAQRLAGLGFSLLATDGTAAAIEREGLAVERINKVQQGSPHCVDRLSAGQIALVVNTTSGPKEIRDSFSIRRTALVRNVPHFTTITAARAAAEAISALREGPLGVQSLQEYQQ